jgi:hypothetical protein
VDRSSGGWQIMKRELKLEMETGSEDFCLTKWFAASMIEDMENDNYRRFLMIPVGPDTAKADTLLVRS